MSSIINWTEGIFKVPSVKLDSISRIMIFIPSYVFIKTLHCKKLLDNLCCKHHLDSEPVAAADTVDSLLLALDMLDNLAVVGHLLWPRYADNLVGQLRVLGHKVGKVRVVPPVVRNPDARPHLHKTGTQTSQFDGRTASIVSKLWNLLAWCSQTMLEIFLP